MKYIICYRYKSFHNCDVDRTVCVSTLEEVLEVYRKIRKLDYTLVSCTTVDETSNETKTIVFDLVAERAY